MSSRGEGTAVYGNVVSGNYFSALGVRPLLGRFFVPEETRTELTHPVLVVSEGFWRTRLGADSAIVGRTVTVNGRPASVVSSGAGVVDWQITLDDPAAQVVAGARDQAGNVEQTPHVRRLGAPHHGH